MSGDGYVCDDQYENSDGGAGGAGPLPTSAHRSKGITKQPIPTPTKDLNKIKIRTSDAAADANPPAEIMNIEEIETSRRPYLSASGPAISAPTISPTKTQETIKSPVLVLKVTGCQREQVVSLAAVMRACAPTLPVPP